MVEVVNVIECCSNWFSWWECIEKFIAGCENPLFYLKMLAKL